MPFTTQGDREKFEPELTDLRRVIEATKMSKGDLTYILYAIAGQTFLGNGKEMSYTACSSAISCLTDAAEQHRTDNLVPYEKRKRLENGDVVWDLPQLPPPER